LSSTGAQRKRAKPLFRPAWYPKCRTYVRRIPGNRGRRSRYARRGSPGRRFCWEMLNPRCDVKTFMAIACVELLLLQRRRVKQEIQLSSRAAALRTVRTIAAA